MDDVELIVNGLSYFGWTSISVNCPMDGGSGAFDLTIVEKWDDTMEAWPIEEGDACEIKVAGTTVISGYVDVFSSSFSATSHTVNIKGRDKIADMIDCSAVHNSSEWNDIDVLQFARIMAAPFGVRVSSNVNVGDKFSTIRLQQGETAFEAIMRYAKQRRLLVNSDGAGGLVITRAGINRASTALVQGGENSNVTGGSGTKDASQRYSEYIVKGQSPWANETTGFQESQVVGRATDPTVTRYRPLLLISETGSTNKIARERAIWESKVRIGKSLSASLNVQGWRQEEGGELWRPNLLVPVFSRYLKINGTMLIRSVSYKRSENDGTVCTLGLVSPLAYSPEPITKPTNGWAEVFKTEAAENA